jgi:hypothetical protein
MVLQNYQDFIEMTSNMSYIVALDVGLKCPRKIHLNTQWGGTECIHFGKCGLKPPNFQSKQTVFHFILYKQTVFHKKSDIFS